MTKAQKKWTIAIIVIVLVLLLLLLLYLMGKKVKWFGNGAAGGAGGIDNGGFPNGEPGPPAEGEPPSEGASFFATPPVTYGDDEEEGDAFFAPIGPTLRLFPSVIPVPFNEREDIPVV